MKKNIVIIILVILLIVACGISAFGLIKYNNALKEIDDLEEVKEKYEKECKDQLIDQTDIIVPDVSGKKVAEAIKFLEDAGFEVNDEQIEINDESVSKGLVVKTIPAAGVKRAKGSKVTLYVSDGENKIVVEDYTGKQYLQIRAALEERGILVYVEKKDVENPKDYKEGVIIGQSVKPGEKLGARDSITLYIPRMDVKLPDFTTGSYTAADVQKFCDEHGITLVIKEDEPDGTQIPSGKMPKKGTVFYQSRPAGYTVASGMTLTIKVAQY